MYGTYGTYVRTGRTDGKTYMPDAYRQGITNGEKRITCYHQYWNLTKEACIFKLQTFKISIVGILALHNLHVHMLQ
jgi:hypothetical protein